MQKLQLNDLLIFPRIYEPLKRWAPNALETLHKKTFIIILTKMIIGRKQILVPVLVYVSKSDWMLNQLTSKSVLHNDNSPKRYLISNFFFTYFMYLTFVFLLLFLYHLCIAVTIFNFLKAKLDLWVLISTYQSWLVKSKHIKFCIIYINIHYFT